MSSPRGGLRVLRGLPLLLLCIALLPVSKAGSATLLADEFTTLDPLLWSVDSNGGGDASTSGGNLIIRSGEQNGGGTWVESVTEVRPDDYSSVTLEVRCRVGSPWTGDPDLWNCGLTKVVHYPELAVYNVFIGAGATDVDGRLMGTVQDGPASLRQYVDIPGVDYTEWHDYKIVVTTGRADFWVDGVNKASIVSQLVPSDVAMGVRLDKSSAAGSDDYLFVDRVALDGQAATSVAPVSWGEIKSRAHPGCP